MIAAFDEDDFDTKTTSYRLSALASSGALRVEAHRPAGTDQTGASTLA
jgi:hypothetical protein